MNAFEISDHVGDIIIVIRSLAIISSSKIAHTKCTRVSSSSAVMTNIYNEQAHRINSVAVSAKKTL